MTPTVDGKAVKYPTGSLFFDLVLALFKDRVHALVTMKQPTTLRSRFIVTVNTVDGPRYVTHTPTGTRGAQPKGSHLTASRALARTWDDVGAAERFAAGLNDAAGVETLP